MTLRDISEAPNPLTKEKLLKLKATLSKLSPYPVISKILFLDFDGVFVTPRAKLADEPNGVDYAAAHVIGGAIIGATVARAPIQIVVVSDWAKDRESALEILRLAHLREFLHPDCWVNLWDSKLSCPRSAFIELWLQSHPEVTHWKVLDDRPDQYWPKHRERIFECHPHNGLTFKGACLLHYWATGEDKGIELSMSNTDALPPTDDRVL